MLSHSPHVVPEDTPLLLAVEAPHPEDALPLMGVQLGVQVPVQVEPMAHVDHLVIVAVGALLTMLLEVLLKVNSLAPDWQMWIFFCYEHMIIQKLCEYLHKNSNIPNRI